MRIQRFLELLLHSTPTGSQPTSVQASPSSLALYVSPLDSQHKTQKKNLPKNINKPQPDIIDVNVNDSFEKDIEYSKEVWITGNAIFQANMNVREKELVLKQRDNGWFSDYVIDYC